MSKNKRSNKLTLSSIIIFVLGLICLIGAAPIRLSTSTLDSNGVLHEPFFFTLPLGFALICLAVIIGAISFIKTITTKK
ncbi:hypothetical protein CBF34_05160 [Vagococcus penaei]|uniref:Uncharacterized protein n=1 Tax=Vagococcus penaei TaxID=633807 RepID=A0A1Q2D6M8_9ENTE|nr:hypothetical protein BW732_06625 [Vagococcus penaei]RSU02911.1 hypothetical protein CBF34_05160 [Vagococcus penaei]